MHVSQSNDLEKPFHHHYHFMPAAIEYPGFGGLGCYVRYKQFEDKPIRVIYRDSNKAFISCPDRDLLLLRDSHLLYGYKPVESVWDEYVPFSLQNANANSDLRMPYYMLNYTDYINSESSPNLRDGRERAPFEAKIVADSGGFQFMMGRFDWIDPLQLVDWYNKNVDLGMVLDIPTHGIENLEDHLTMAKAQKRNTDLMLDNARESLEFFNIIHGEGQDFFDAYHDIVFDERITRLAVGGVYLGSYLPSLFRVFSSIKKAGEFYKHVHFLGVWNLLQLIPIMRFSTHGVIDTITSDASSAIQSANQKGYVFHPTIDSKWEVRDIGNSSACYIPNHHVHLPCSCPVCSSIKYLDVLSVVPGAMVTHMLAHHNMHSMNNYVERMRPIVEQQDIKTLTELMAAQVGTRKGIREAVIGLQLADDMAACSTDKLEFVRGRYSSYLTTFEADVREGSLFGDDEVESEEDDVEYEYPPEVQRKLSIANRYLEGRDGTHGKRNEVKVKKVIGLSAKSSKSKTSKRK